MDFITTALTGFFTYINTITGGNQMIAGGLMLLIPAVFYFMVGYFKKIVIMIYDNLFVTVTFDNAYNGMRLFRAIERELTMLDHHILHYFMPKTYWIEPKFRTDVTKVIFNRYNTSNVSLEPVLGISTHYLKFDGSLIKATMNEEKTSNTESHFRLIISGREKTIQKILRHLEMGFNNNNNVNDNESVRYSYNGDLLENKIYPQPLDSLCLDNKVRIEIKKILDGYLNIERLEENRSIGLPHRLVILLHGEPGNGKSKLITSIADHLNLNINYVNVEQLDMQGLNKALSDSTDMHVMEDIHSVSAFTNGEPKINIIKNSDEINIEGILSETKPNSDFGRSISLSDFLNVLNGVAPIDRKVIILTTNYIDVIDPAILRPGRIDYVLELPRIHAETANNWLEGHIPDFKNVEGFTKPIRGCDLHSYLVQRIEPKVIEEKLPKVCQFNHNETNVVDLK